MKMTILKFMLLFFAVSKSFAMEEQDIRIDVQPGLFLVKLTGEEDQTQAFKSIIQESKEKIGGNFIDYKNDSSGEAGGTFYLFDDNKNTLGAIKIADEGKIGMDFYGFGKKDFIYQNAFSKDIVEKSEKTVVWYAEILFTPFLEKVDSPIGKNILNALETYYQKKHSIIKGNYNNSFSEFKFGGFLYQTILREGKTSPYSQKLLSWYDSGCFAKIARYIPCECCTGKGTWVAFFMTEMTEKSYPQETQPYFWQETEIVVNKLKEGNASRGLIPYFEIIPNLFTPIYDLFSFFKK